MHQPTANDTIAPEPLTLVHAGAAVLREPAALRSLEHYLRRCADDPVVLVHGSRLALREIAQEVGVPEVAIDEGPRFSGEDDEAAALAVELGATVLEYAIDRPALTRPGGRRLELITVREAEGLARTAALGERIRDKLIAAAGAVRQGLRFARIGGPLALLRNSATVIAPDPDVQVGLPIPELPLTPGEQPGAIAARAAHPPRVSGAPRPAGCDRSAHREPDAGSVPASGPPDSANPLLLLGRRKAWDGYRGRLRS